MLDISKARIINLTDYIVVHGEQYRIHTEFYYGIRFMKLLEEKPLLTDFDSFYSDVYHIPADRQAGIDALVVFYNPAEPLPNRDVITASGDYKAYDYILDSSMIYAAFMQQYHIDLLDTPLHWYKFLALFHNLKGTRLNDVMGYRGYNPNDKTDEKKFMTKQKQLWEIREEATEEEQEMIDRFNAQFD